MDIFFGILRKFPNSYPRKIQKVFNAILLSFFITYFVNFSYSSLQLPKSSQAETYSEPHQTFMMQVLARIVNGFDAKMTVTA